MYKKPPNDYNYIHSLSYRNRIGRIIWNAVWLFLYRPTPRSLHIWRCLILRIFGAKVGKNVHPYPSSRIWAPWNLILEDSSCIGDYVNCYCVDKIKIGKNTIISQYSFLCTASHDYSSINFTLVTAPINIGNNVWVAADVFIAPNINIDDGVVVKARSTVLQDLPKNVIVQGNPAIVVKNRIIK